MRMRTSLNSSQVDRLKSVIASFLVWFGSLSFGLRMTPILLLAWALTVWRLGASDLWLDEAISYWISSKSLVELVQFTMGQSREHPPLYYALLHFWMGLAGESEFALRVLSAFGGLVAVTTLATLARRWYGVRTAILAVVMMATAPLWLQQVRDARMYPWLAALALLNIYALDRGLSLSRLRDWGLFFVSLFLMLGTQYFGGHLLVSYGFYLLVMWRYLPRPGRLRLVLLLAALGILGGGWIISQPGPRGSLLGAASFALSARRSWARLFELLGHWALGDFVFFWPAAVAWLLAFPLWLLALIGIGTARRSHHHRASLPWLLALLVLLPIGLAFFILPTTHPRHVMATYGLYSLALALGIDYVFLRGITIQRFVQWLVQRLKAGRFVSRWTDSLYAIRVGAVVLVAILSLNLILAIRQIVPITHAFSAPLRYISEHARSDEPIIYTYYFDWPLDDYYNRRQLPSSRLLTTDIPITRADASSMAKAAFENLSSLWLVLYPGPENTDLLEKAFNRMAFPTDRVWFPGDRGVVHYFSALPLQEHTTTIQWENGISLKQWWSSEEVVAAGDALRLRFRWQTSTEISDDALMVLRLRGSDQTIWAAQTMSPCNGRCPTSDWFLGSVLDQMAFYIPTDIPPGVYELQVGWVNQAGGASVGRLASESMGVVDLPLTKLTVLPPLHTSDFAPAPYLSQAVGLSVRPGLTLTSVDFADPSARSGGVLKIPMQFTTSDHQPSLDVRLHLDGQGQAYMIPAPLGPVWFASSLWSPGYITRVQPQFQIPGTIPPGRYDVSVVIDDPASEPRGAKIPIGLLRVEDRPHRFDVPNRGVPVGASCNEGIQLLQYDLPETASPGSRIPFVLIWQADGPTLRNWKVFAHLTDSAGVLWSQADAYPMTGQALTSSWQQGEVIVDTHDFDLPADLPVGRYTIHVGFYDDVTGERLVCGESGAITLDSVLEIISEEK